MKNVNLIYLSAFIDAEGTITIDQLVRKNKTNSYKTFKISVSVTNTFIQIIKQIHKQFGGYLIKLQEPKGCKPYLKVIWECKNAIKLIRKIYPHLIIKKSQAKVALLYWNLRQSFKNLHCRNRSKIYYNKELKFVSKMRRLNKRGK